MSHLAIDSNPAVVLGGMLGNFLQRELLLVRRGCRRRGGGGSGSGCGSRSTVNLGRSAAHHNGGGVAAGLLNGDGDSWATTSGGECARALQEAHNAGPSLASVHDALQQGTAAQPVLAVHATSDLAGCVQASDGLRLRSENLSLGADVQATHGVMHDGGDLGDVEVVVGGPRHPVEELAVSAHKV